MVDALVLGTSIERCESSSLSGPTTVNNKRKYIMKTVSSTLTNSDYLHIAESRAWIVGLDYPESNENARLEFIINNLKSKMTEQELLEYNAVKNSVKTAAEIEAIRLATIKRMNENVDRPSI